MVQGSFMVAWLTERGLTDTQLLEGWHSKKIRPIKLDYSVQVWSVTWTQTFFQHDVDIDTYVDNMYWHTEIVCEREATWFEEILFI